MRHRRRLFLGAGLATVAIVSAVVIVNSASNDPGDSKQKSASSTNFTTEANPFRTGRTLVIPHGGGDGEFPEDTMIAYDRTMAMGADFVDVDLRLSQDDVVVNFHDETVDRMTGTSGEVDKMTFSQLSKLDAGATFTPPGTPATAPAAELHPFSGIGVTIPSFESVLQRFPHTFISIDLKDETADVIQRVCALLVRYGRLGDVFVGSNSDDQIVQFRKQCPTVRTSATLADVRADNQARTTNAPNFVSAITVDQPPFRANGRQLVDAASVAWSHQHGIAIMPWVVNDESDMQYLISIGVDAIYTSYPDRLLRLLGRCTAQC